MIHSFVGSVLGITQRELPSVVATNRRCDPHAASYGQRQLVSREILRWHHHLGLPGGTEAGSSPGRRRVGVLTGWACSSCSWARVACSRFTSFSVRMIFSPL